MTDTLMHGYRESDRRGLTGGNNEVWCFWEQQALWQRQAAEKFAAHIG
ncbi:hypothetical protein ACGLWX_07535 [Halomonas sp. HMF6819]|nr:MULTISPECIES: hypothetical protein [unclassified Halomonas]